MSNASTTPLTNEQAAKLLATYVDQYSAQLCDGRRTFTLNTSTLRYINARIREWKRNLENEKNRVWSSIIIPSHSQIFVECKLAHTRTKNNFSVMLFFLFCSLFIESSKAGFGSWLWSALSPTSNNSDSNLASDNQLAPLDCEVLEEFFNIVPTVRIQSNRQAAEIDLSMFYKLSTLEVCIISVTWTCSTHMLIFIFIVLFCSCRIAVLYLRRAVIK